MTVQELIGRLEDFDPNAEIRLMTQESWPFENSIRGICDSQELIDAEDGSCDDHDEDPEEVVYIVEGSQLGYGNKDAWNIAA